MEDKLIKVSLKRKYTSFVYQAKEILKEHEQVELHGLGEATANTVRAAEMLCSLGYATLAKFETVSVSEEDHGGVSRSRAKIIIVLNKAASFEKAYADFESNKTTRKIE
mmetsp:Transcript_3912/g.3703  ORF Transcript_3912/g.3703 Transcript_3912/m.3703 type:complete len:109 (+) Transcript_3912:41-367(+)|eukprot:CAMPEP_0202948586 /NCGR_PEP_ID=MMETSP1395-20130829/13768_1 /ASSEMBLY_ACC=CAM_ASM_000871 /TAXON_ID=5961 /ORGANISM="Blepharisma japonicum, Strain Stock R1072" /LENGTH=108 /DNA_ID=CAMNT_0049650759 /DNA_START=17 /DNA_END=343 /DNA_ORIENTATION=+